MVNHNEYKLYTYRYMWKLNGSDKIALKVITDTMEAHDGFKQKLIEADEVLSAACEYVSEIDIQFIGIVNTFKEEKK